MPTVPRNRAAVGRTHSMKRLPLEVGQVLLGLSCLGGGVVLTLTLWLMPIGVPMGLIGAALLEALGETEGHS